MKLPIQNPHMKEVVYANLLKKTKKKVALEEFSFASIKRELEKKYQVDEKELERSLDQLQSEEKILVRERKNVFLPKEAEQRFKDLIRPLDQSVLIVLVSIIVGFIVYSLILSFFNRSVTLTLSPTDPNSIAISLANAILLPLVIGFFLVAIFLTRLYKYIYSNAGFFRNFIEFFGGSDVWKYAMILGFALGIVYILFCALSGKPIDPNGLMISSGVVFITVLGLGAKGILPKLKKEKATKK